MLDRELTDWIRRAAERGQDVERVVQEAKSHALILSDERRIKRIYQEEFDKAKARTEARAAMQKACPHPPILEDYVSDGDGTGGRMFCGACGIYLRGVG